MCSKSQTFLVGGQRLPSTRPEAGIPSLMMSQISVALEESLSRKERAEPVNHVGDRRAVPGHHVPVLEHRDGSHWSNFRRQGRPYRRRDRNRHQCPLELGAVTVVVAVQFPVLQGGEQGLQCVSPSRKRKQVSPLRRRLEIPRHVQWPSENRALCSPLSRDPHCNGGRDTRTL